MKNEVHMVVSHDDNFILSEDAVYHPPLSCEECGGIMDYKGIGEYECEKCGHLQYDDYGKVRNYVETHPGATAAQASQATGVKQKTINLMLRESRLEVSADSHAFLTCEICGTPIRSGHYCAKCEVEHNRMVAEKARQERNKHVAGYGETFTDEEGAKRFIRQK